MSIEARNLRVVHFSDKRITDPAGKTMLPWRVYQSARNAVLEACRPFGSIGGMEACPIVEGLSDEVIEQEWKGGEWNPAFFIVDDQLNYERYLYIEIFDAEAVTMDWLVEVVKSLEHWSEWGVCISNIRDGYLIILPPVLLIMGPPFKDCTDVKSVLEACARCLDTD